MSNQDQPDPFNRKPQQSQEDLHGTPEDHKEEAPVALGKRIEEKIYSDGDLDVMLPGIPQATEKWVIEYGKSVRLITIPCRIDAIGRKVAAADFVGWSWTGQRITTDRHGTCLNPYSFHGVRHVFLGFDGDQHKVDPEKPLICPGCNYLDQLQENPNICEICAGRDKKTTLYTLCHYCQEFHLGDLGWQASIRGLWGLTYKASDFLRGVK